MRFFVLGATGMVGKAILAAARARGHDVVAAARRGSEIVLDALDERALSTTIGAATPDVVVNCTSYGSVDACANDPSAAYRVNARLNARLAEICRNADFLVAVGTDHYFTGDGDSRHDEFAAVRLLNDYAIAKYAGEHLALTWSRCLAIRTNVTGFRGWPGQPTFVEWASAGLKARTPMALFDDYYCSTIDSGSLALAAVELAERGISGLYNVACREVVSKKRFVFGLAERLSLPTDHLRTASVRTLSVPRAESAGLDVSMAEKVLGRALPDFDQVIEALVRGGAGDT